MPLPTYVTAPKAPPVGRRIDVSAGRPWAVDDEPTQEFPVLTDELIAQIEAEMREKTSRAEVIEVEVVETIETVEVHEEIVEIEHKRAVGE